MSQQENSRRPSPADTARDRLLERIGQRREEVEAYLAEKRPLVKRLQRITVLSSAVSAVAAAGPGIGGSALTDTLEDFFGLPASLEIWRVLCLVAMLLAGAAAFSARTLGSDELTQGIVGATALSKELEDLATLVEFGQVDVDAAVELLRGISARVPVPG
ncbi:hypothetical protein [Kineosporia succinea]|uniref:Superfamily III holin-X n=1 Tax=Kineosporia succinea TaxID=84632 RepID=A0ABT9PG53_9ACTN|nr:hypothetical protein [Kineosporia succinea]MDP9830945.1 hypothetical protein [Kineosporia succinea]